MQITAAKVLALNFMGCLWGYIGMNLIRKGLPSLFLNKNLTLALSLIAVAVIIGFFKSKFVLKKTATRLISRLERVKNYFSIFKLFDLKFVLLILCMMGLGISFNFLPGFEAFKGVVRTAIGYGLLQSSFYFFKPAFVYGIRG
jgi:hypothetical protein